MFIHKFCFLRLGLALFLGFNLYSCETTDQKGERLAKQYCASCHLFPKPQDLDKASWKNVLPQMAFRMGFEDMTALLQMTSYDKKVIMSTLPAQPMVSEEEWKLIEQYYLVNSPSSLDKPNKKQPTQLTLFEGSSFHFKGEKTEMVTMLEFDSTERKLYVGTRDSHLHTLSEDLKVIETLSLPSPPSQILFEKDKEPLVLLMGIMDPNEELKGKIIPLNKNDFSFMPIIDSLQRPVSFEQAHLNRDTLKDLVVCAFGNYTGALLAFEKQRDGYYKKHTLQKFAGARKVILQDFDRNGLTDILVLMTQGDERIILLHNQGNFKFRINTLLRFPPMHGSSYFDVADFNHDGKYDILYTNGDNADYSITLKPYHGVHIFLNDGTNQFKESWFYPMHGASQAIPRDFDADGDLDIAAISFFPDFETQAEQGFIYFENTSPGFDPQITKVASKGRWLVMEALDLENDGDHDLILGSLNFPTLVPYDLTSQWNQEKTSLLILKNKLH